MVVKGYKIYTYEQLIKNKEIFGELFEYLNLHGSHCMASSTFQPKMNYFIIEKIGYIAYGKYKKRSKTRYVLSDPVCAKENTIQLIKKFLEYSPKACFVQVSENVAKILTYFGFYANVLGTEYSIESKDMQFKKFNPENYPEYLDMKKELTELQRKKDLLYANMKDKKNRKEFWKIKTKIDSIKKKIESFAKEKEYSFFDILFSNPERKHIKRDFNSAQKEGYVVEEMLNQDLDKMIHLEKISQEWLTNNTVSKKEMAFLTRPFSIKNLFSMESKIFLLKNNKNATVGFLELFPIFSDGKVIGYYADILRTKKDIPGFAINYLLLKTLESIFLNNYSTYHLGLAPFSNLKRFIINGKNKDNSLSYKLFKILYEKGSFLYNAKGQAYHKEKFKFTKTHSFFCSKNKIQFKNILDSFELCNLGIRRFFK